MEETIGGKTLAQWRQQPIIGDLMDLRETFWVNPGLEPASQGLGRCGLTMADVEQAADRLARFAPYLAQVFPETAPAAGLIESPLEPAPQLQQALARQWGLELPGRLLLKLDSHLPISGSIKARGGIYEVLKHAEDLALAQGMLTPDQDYSILNSDKMRDFYSQYSIAVGSTGNLGLSIGIISAKLGFRVTVHMSADARQWKKDLLRSKGVQVAEYQSDYSKAVEEGRRQARQDPNCYFVDDENSQNLFLGYAVAALRLREQLRGLGCVPGPDRPLFAFLPCGVGGGPGGVAFGLKLLYGDFVHCFFAEPTHAPCMTLGLASGLHDQVCVQQFGIDNKTAADGLAVGRPSRFVGRLIQPLLSGSYTIADQALYRYLRLTADRQDIWLEPSALAGMEGPRRLLGTRQGREYLEAHGLEGRLESALWLPWATGGSMVPRQIMEDYYRQGQAG